MAAGLAFGALAFAEGLAQTVAVLVIAGVLVSPMTIWAQTIRMRLIPAELRGRTFGTLRTLMQATPPVGGALAGLLLSDDVSVASMAAVMAAVMALPGALGLVLPALADERTRTPELAVD
jgi:hypothetical protein